MLILILLPTSIISLRIIPNHHLAEVINSISQSQKIQFWCSLKPHHPKVYIQWDLLLYDIFWIKTWNHEFSLIILAIYLTYFKAATLSLISNSKIGVNWRSMGILRASDIGFSIIVQKLMFFKGTFYCS